MVYNDRSSCFTLEFINRSSCFTLGFMNVIRQRYGFDFLGHPYWTCSIFLVPFFGASMSSTFLILSMTFERFYSIVRPHKAASFNTVKKAKITIVCIFVFFTLFNVPHLFLSDMDGARCVPWGKGTHFIGQFYFYTEMIIAFILPFILLLIMNCVIIYTLKSRSNLIISTSQSQGQGENEGHVKKAKTSDRQITITLLVVTFSFLLLTTPIYVLFIYMMSFRMGNTPRGFATFYFIYHLGEKSYYTNYAINFFLYVISGQKFRNDLINLLLCKK